MRTNLICLLTTLLALLIPLTTLGEYRHPLRAQALGTGSSFEPTLPLRVTTFIPGKGRVRMRFNQIRRPIVDTTLTSSDGTEAANQAVLLLSGTVRHRTGTSTLAGSIYHRGNTPYLFASFQSHRRRSGRPYYYRVTVPLEGPRPTALLTRQSLSVHTDKACGATAPSTIIPQSSSIQALAIETIETQKRIDISIDADQDLFNLFGTETSAKIQTMINESNTIYSRDLSVVLNVTRINVFTDSTGDFGSTDPFAKLTAFRDYTVAQNFFGDQDAYHLISGQSFDGNIIGLAWLSSICSAPSRSFGINQYTTLSHTPLTFSHELGHNFGGEHVDQNPPTIMSPAISFSATGFSDDSITQISDYIDSNSSCLAVVDEDGEEVIGSDPETVIDVTLAASVSKAGALEATVTLPGINTDCTVSLRGGTKADTISHQLPSMISTPASAEELTFQATIKKSTKPGKKNKVFLRAEVRCTSGAAGNSTVLDLTKQVKKIKAKGKSKKKKKKSKGKKKSGGVSGKKWIKLLTKAVTLSE